MKNKIIFEGVSTKGNNYFIRYPNSKDAEKMNEYINILSADKTFVRYQGQKFSLKEEKIYLKDSLKRIKDQQAVQLLVFSGNQIIGISSIDLSDGAQSHEGTLGISILNSYRNEGIGKVLLELVLKEAEIKIPDLKIVTLSVFGNNPIAIKFYEEFGFKEYGRLPKGIFYNKKFEDNVFMYKTLRS